MFDVFNELKRVNEILADASFCDRWQNDAYLFGIWAEKEGKGLTEAIKIADVYASKSENYNKFSKEDYVTLKGNVNRGFKASKNGYNFKTVDQIEIDAGYIDYLRGISDRNIRNILFTTLVWTTVKKLCGIETDIIFLDSERKKIEKQSHATYKPKEILPYFTEEIAVKYGRRNAAGIRGYHPSWMGNVELKGETLTISGSKTDLGYAYGDYQDDDLHNPGRFLDTIIYGTEKCCECGKVIPKHRLQMYTGKYYCPEHLIKAKTEKRIETFTAQAEDTKDEITCICRKCGETHTINSRNKAWEKALTGNYICSKCRQTTAKVQRTCTRCGIVFTVNKKSANYNEIMAGTNCECSKCFRKTKRERLSKSKKK